MRHAFGNLEVFAVEAIVQLYFRIQWKLVLVGFVVGLVRAAAGVEVVSFDQAALVAPDAC